MMRHAFKMKLKPGVAAEYRRRHDEIWPELAAELQAAGVSDYSIFLDEETLTLFAVQKLSDQHTAADLPRSPIVSNSLEYPPPRKYPTFAGQKCVASRHAPASSGVISQYGFMTGFPPRLCLPVPSIVVDPELMRWMKPPPASPVTLFPVTRFTASGLQYVRTSEKIAPCR